MRYLGRLLQYVGLVSLPAAIFMELTGLMGRAFGLSQMLIMMVFGFCAFQVGRLLEGFGTSEG